MTSVSGRAIHSGRLTTVRLHRDRGPLRFRTGGGEIVANLASVAGSDRATTLASGGARVAMVEHLLAALRIAGHFSGVVIEVDGDELPILDGSAAQWSDAVAQLADPEPPPPPLVVTEAVSLSLAGGSAALLPGEERLEYEIDFAHPAIGCQRWAGGPTDYPALLAARTFGFARELDGLRRRGLAQGADLEHAIVFADEGPMRPLRSPDEPVRHKALDAIGDLSLLGRPIAGCVRVQRGSHALHHEIMRRLPTDRGAEG